MARLIQFLTEDNKKRWMNYLKNSPMLRAGVKVLNTITSKGYESYLVGGAVRDIILGKSFKDADIATNAPVEELEKMFKTYDIGKNKDFGIVVTKVDGFQIEIAVYRADGKYLDGRRPESVSFNVDLKGDMSRRDLTINAMAIDKDGNIIDHFEGQKAIKDKVIQTVGNPFDRFEEDRLRLMRSARFAGKFGFDIEPNTKKAMSQMAHKLKDLAPERIKDELFNMASASGAKFADTIRILDDTGILNVILPELMKLKDFKEMEDYHPEAYTGSDRRKGTPFDHVMAALRKNQIADPLVNMGILLHDIGKGTTYANIDGKHTFHGHAEAAKDIIDTIAKRLKMSNKEKDALLFAAVNHMKIHIAYQMKPSKIIKLVNDENWEILKMVAYADAAARKGLFNQSEFDSLIDEMEAINKKWGEKITGTTIKIVDGNRVMTLTGLPSGKKVGMIIKKVTDEVLNKGIRSDKEIDDLIMKVYQETKG